MIKPVKIGKNLIEILTDGMYKNPLFMYREYVQNAADSIDEAVENRILKGPRDGEIKISIEPNNSIIIEGVPADLPIGKEKEINLNTKRPEFLEWKWIEGSKLPDVAVTFKVKVYKKLKKELTNLYLI